MEAAAVVVAAVAFDRTFKACSVEWVVVDAAAEAAVLPGVDTQPPVTAFRALEPAADLPAAVAMGVATPGGTAVGPSDVPQDAEAVAVFAASSVTAAVDARHLYAQHRAAVVGTDTVVVGTASLATSVTEWLTHHGLVAVHSTLTRLSPATADS